MVDDKTPHLQMPLPHPSNLLGEDVLRLAQALTLADAAIKALQTAMATAQNTLGTHGHAAATAAAAGFMAAADKAKLDGIAAQANAYSHPAEHPPSIIKQDAGNRFMTDLERQKLAGIEASANAYAHPAEHPPSIIKQDTNNRLVSDAEKQAWSNKMAVGLWGHAGPCVSVTDFNVTPDANAFLMASAATGAPNATGWWLVQQMVHNNRWKTQIAYGFAGNDGQIVMRQMFDTAWGAWSANLVVSDAEKAAWNSGGGGEAFSAF
ncbi:pyocin knob domain-containing protein [Limnohabitans sp. WS1]|uniref:pyocin knob domain-containing protein n=1 Tax=Limnohabitans sp. WS1 TaxID=1100726 RepID=UPI000D3B8F6A|nr:pyocin knob domain-containing protein [Limnohabitans sp. WS1]PUE20350.1 hypothetical protein B9Z48_05400 [Limnohabitans sp. WS1]